MRRPQPGLTLLQYGGECVECIDNNGCATSATGSICETNADQEAPQYTCRGCVDNIDCASDVCVADTGACVDAAEVLYVSKDGNDDNNDACARATPCGTINHALTRVVAADAHRYVRILDDATYAETVVLRNAVSVSLIGGNLIALDSDTIIFEVADEASLELRDVALSSLPTADNPVGIECLSAQGEASVTLSRITIELASSNGGGIEVSGCDINLSGSRIVNNKNVGIRINNSSFRIVNNIIAGNGDPALTGSQGGVQLVNAGVNGTPTQVFAFNTVVANDAPATAEASGVYCFGKSNTTIVAHSNIVRFDGSGSPGATLITGSNCSFTHSNIEGQATLEQAVVGDATNNDEVPAFLDAAGGDYALDQSDTACVNKGKLDTDISIDINGDPRPLGGPNTDIGADEIDETAGA